MTSALTCVHIVNKVPCPANLKQNDILAASLEAGSRMLHSLPTSSSPCSIGNTLSDTSHSKN
jgi:hypothetical protein